MGRKRKPGLIMRAGIWHIDKVMFGRRVCQSTETARLDEAERTLARIQLYVSIREIGRPL
jgi:hypothetical protein